MSLRSKTIFAVLATALAFFASFSGTLNAAWVKVQDSPAVYRDTRTNLEWTVTLGSTCSNAQAQSLVQKYGFRLPTPCELRDVINCSCGACQLCLYSGHHNAYETCDPCTLVSVRHGRAVVKARRACSRTWVVGVRGGNGQDPLGQIGKLYVLTVWGTNSEDNKGFYAHFANEVRVSMQSFGMCPVWNQTGGGGIPYGQPIDTSDPENTALKASLKTLDETPETFIGEENAFCAEYITLKGDTATNENVLEKCRYISQKAQKNDVIFVYMCCHGNTKTIGNQRHHVLYPAAVDTTDLEDIEKGLKREDIVQALKENEHRLTVLITDSCARRQDQSALLARDRYQFARPCAAAEGAILTCRLEMLLRTNTGFINWNSAAPKGSINDEGEFTFYYQPVKDPDGKDLESNGIVVGGEPTGSFFGPWFEYAFNIVNIRAKYPYKIVDLEKDAPSDNEQADDQNVIIPDEAQRQTIIASNRLETSRFFEELKAKVRDNYADWKRDPQITTDLNEIVSQPTQTLFDFEDKGYVIVEGDIDIDNVEGDTGNTEGDTGNTEGDTGNTEGDAGNTEGDAGNTEGDAGNPDDIINKIEGDGSTKD